MTLEADSFYGSRAVGKMVGIPQNGNNASFFSISSRTGSNRAVEPSRTARSATVTSDFEPTRGGRGERGESSNNNNNNNVNQSMVSATRPGRSQTVGNNQATSNVSMAPSDRSKPAKEQNDFAADYGRLVATYDLTQRVMSTSEIVISNNKTQEWHIPAMTYIPSFIQDHAVGPMRQGVLNVQLSVSKFEHFCEWLQYGEMIPSASRSVVTKMLEYYGIVPRKATLKETLLSFFLRFLASNFREEHLEIKYNSATGVCKCVKFTPPKFDKLWAELTKCECKTCPHRFDCPTLTSSPEEADEFVDSIVPELLNALTCNPWSFGHRDDVASLGANHINHNALLFDQIHASAIYRIEKAHRYREHFRCWPPRDINLSGPMYNIDSILSSLQFPLIREFRETFNV